MGRTGDLDFTRWDFLDSEQLGVDVVDRRNHKIGPNIAKRRLVGLNWYPIDRHQQVLVGSIDRYGFYDGVGAEADWNIYIKPSPAFSHILDDALPNADPDDVHKCRNSAGYCVEAEVTPDEHFYDNRYFPKSGDSPLVGHDIGVYGPWVAEEAHGWRPEIHPAQALWWRDTTAGPQRSLHTYHLMIVQDDSNRFDRSDDFSGTIGRPWSKPPIEMEFTIAVRVPAGRHKRLTIEELYGRNVHDVTRSTARESTLPLPAAQSLHPTEVSVRPPDAHRAHVDIGFADFTPRPGPLHRSDIHGYVTVRCQVGKGDRGDEGYLVLRVTEEIVPRRPDVVTT